MHLPTTSPEAQRAAVLGASNRGLRIIVNGVGVRDLPSARAHGFAQTQAYQ